MVEVKVLREHGNVHGGEWLKPEGSTYSMPETEAANLAEQKLVEIVDGEGSDRAPGRNEGMSGGSAGAQPKRPAGSGKAGA